MSGELSREEVIYKTDFIVGHVNSVVSQAYVQELQAHDADQRERLEGERAKIIVISNMLEESEENLEQAQERVRELREALGTAIDAIIATEITNSDGMDIDVEFYLEDVLAGLRQARVLSAHDVV